MFNKNDSDLPPGHFIIELMSKIRLADINGVYMLINMAEREKYDINFDDPKTKYTPLHFAITKATEKNESEMLAIIKLLHKAGCDINKKANDTLGNTPIHTACR